MAKRNTDTEIWSEDWFIDLKGKHQLFYFYIKDRCDHAGFWRPNFKSFEQITGLRVNPKNFLDEINSDFSTGEKVVRERIRVLENGRWWIINFIGFHFPILNLNNRFHRSVYDTFRKNVSCLNTEQYGFEVKDTSKTPLREVNETPRRKKEEERKQKEERRKQEEENKLLFEEARIQYPGTKRGLDTEFENFKKKHEDYLTSTPLLLDAINTQMSWRKEMFEADMFVPEWKMFQTWINQRCWEDEKPTIIYKPKRQFGRQEVSNDFLKEQMEIPLS